MPVPELGSAQDLPVMLGPKLCVPHCLLELVVAQDHAKPSCAEPKEPEHGRSVCPVLYVGRRLRLPEFPLFCSRSLLAWCGYVGSLALGCFHVGF